MCVSEREGDRALVVAHELVPLSLAPVYVCIYVCVCVCEREREREGKRERERESVCV